MLKYDTISHVEYIYVICDCAMQILHREAWRWPDFTCNIDSAFAITQTFQNVNACAIIMWKHFSLNFGQIDSSALTIEKVSAITLSLTVFMCYCNSLKILKKLVNNANALTLVQ